MYIRPSRRKFSTLTKTSSNFTPLVNLVLKIPLYAAFRVIYIYDHFFRYCNARETRFGWDFSGSSYLDELHILLREVIMVRRQVRYRNESFLDIRSRLNLSLLI